MTNPLKGGGLKKVLGIAVLLFVAYLVFSDPTGSAGAVNSGASTVESGANSISTFFAHLELGGGQS